MPPLVSIVTPVYNAVRWLPETLESVRRQTLTEWEHILVDDNSTDDSIQILQQASLADSRVRMVKFASNCGPARARNHAIELASGRYIALLDADDIWLPQKLERCVASMRQHGYSFAYHDYRHISQDGLKVSSLVRGPDLLDLRSLHTRRGYGGCLTVMVDRAAVPNFHFPLEDHTLPEDFSAWLWLVRQGHYGHRIPEDLGRYRLTEGGRSSRKSKSALRAWRVYREKERLPLPTAVSWWTQYAWNAFWLYQRTRPV